MQTDRTFLPMEMVHRVALSVAKGLHFASRQGRRHIWLLLAMAAHANAQTAVPRDSTLPTLFHIGDSTVRNGSGNGSNGQWGGATSCRATSIPRRSTSSTARWVVAAAERT